MKKVMVSLLQQDGIMMDQSLKYRIMIMTTKVSIIHILGQGKEQKFNFSLESSYHVPVIEAIVTSSVIDLLLLQ